MSKRNTLQGLPTGMRRGGGGGGGGGQGRSQGGIRFGNEPGMRPAGMSLADEEAMEQRMLAGTGNTDKRARHQHDQEVFHTLLRHHDQIQRELTRLPNGIRSLTTSVSPEIVGLLHDHVPAMHHRLEENFGLRFWDPAFPEIFAQREKVRMEVTLVPNGVLVEETSEDPNVVTLIQAHGAVVSLFVQRGFAQAQEISPLPDSYQRVLGG
ncbi:hypothetical protein [Acidithiobacillus sp.]|uniref:hypothetical protein n=1 Tax=Acidithiobacillus sp. TaxID=1872118 RepID=UPI0026087AF6|nr:hypothetical protein [Acidithiobacillus sp.]